MKSILSIILCCVSICTLAQKVANFSTGTVNSNDFEEFSFWSNNEISYTYGSNSKMLKIGYLGKSNKYNNSFTIQFPNKHTYEVIVESSSITVIGITTKYRKVMGWYYEGPINGRGTYCSSCAQSSKEALKVLKKHYL